MKKLSLLFFMVCLSMSLCFALENSYVFDIAELKVNDKIIISDYTTTEKYLVSIYLVNDSETVLAARYVHSKLHEISKTGFEEIPLGSFYEDFLSKYNQVKVDVSVSGINVDCGVRNSDMYIVLTNNTEKSDPVRDGMKIDCEQIRMLGDMSESYYLVRTNTGLRERINFNNFYFINSSEYGFFSYRIYGETTDGKIRFLGGGYLQQPGICNEFYNLYPIMMKYKNFYVLTDNDKVNNVYAGVKKNRLYFTFE